MYGIARKYAIKDNLILPFDSKKGLAFKLTAAIQYREKDDSVDQSWNLSIWKREKFDVTTVQSHVAQSDRAFVDTGQDSKIPTDKESILLLLCTHM